MLRISAALPGSFPAESNIAVFCFEKNKKPVGGYLFGPLIEKSFKLAQLDRFNGSLGEISVIHPKDKNLSRVLFIGLGSEKELDLETIRVATAAVAKKAIQLNLSSIYLRPPQVGGAVLLAQAVSEGALLGTYRFTQFKSAKEKESAFNSLVFISKDSSEINLVRQGIKQGEIYSHSTNFARDLINTPPSDMTPEIMVKKAKTALKNPIKIRVFNKSQLEKMGMGALLGVNRGSGKPPFFLHLVYKPKGKALRKIGICGKGITFDSGGLSLKPAKSMETMKYDMAGAATVISIFKALADLKPSIEVHGFTPITENMPGCNALKPGDVVKALNGKTIEVLNTDAEGRLVLADALSYASKQNLDEIVDLATLTGACVVALGSSIAAILGNNDKLKDRIKNASALSGEKVWELPLEKDYDAHIKSKVADLKNIGLPMVAGTIIGALFLKHFVDEKIPWAHLDIASTGWSDEGKPLSPAGATGVMVRTLLNYILSYN